MTVAENEEVVGLVKRIAVVVLVALALQGCGGLKETLGMGSKRAPDEMQVVSRPPLSLPPDYNLRPPAPGAPPTGQEPVRDQAAKLLLGDRRAEPSALSQGEQAFLTGAGADRADPDIRTKLAQESPYYGAGDKSIVDRLMFWRDETGGDEAQVVDASREAERLKRNASEGLPATAGETPMIERKPKSGIEELFGVSIF
ncbi:MAG: hypothetical protein CMM50_12445 [Rhodospirillaceae bacterium]|nr:hypothetical protein [Rhodospirillaceae bacterium]|tara:strand:+ start:284 stop:880 length:597 start_codon:yes stop_codon:yes gene_type:complete